MGIAHLAAELFCFAAAAFSFDEFFLCAAGAVGFLTAGLRGSGETILAFFLAVLFENLQESLHRELTIFKLRARVRSGDRSPCREVTDGAGRGDFVDVLATGTGAPGEADLEVPGIDASGF